MEKTVTKQFILRIEQSIEKYFLLALSYNDSSIDMLIAYLQQQWQKQHESIQSDLAKIQMGRFIARRPFIRKIIRQVIYARLAKHMQIQMLQDDSEAFFLHWREYALLAYRLC